MYGMGAARLLSSKEAAYKDFKRMSCKYKNEGVYICEEESMYPFLPCVLMAIGAAIICLCFFTEIEKDAGAVIVISFAVINVAAGLFLFFKWLYSPSVKLEKDRLIIKYKNREIEYDIKHISTKCGSTALYIMREGEANFNEIRIFTALVCEIAALACLINYLKENELEKIENVTLDEFSVIYKKVWRRRHGVGKLFVR